MRCTSETEDRMIWLLGTVLAFVGFLAWLWVFGKDPDKPEVFG